MGKVVTACHGMSIADALTRVSGMCPEQVDRCVYTTVLPARQHHKRKVLTLSWTYRSFRGVRESRNTWYMVEIFMQSNMLAVSV